MRSTRDTATPRGPSPAIPGHLAPCFQEYRLDALDLASDRDLVIERVLAYGDRADVRWLLEHVGRRAVADFLAGPSARRLPRRRFVLWSVLLGDGQLPPPADTGAVWPH